MLWNKTISACRCATRPRPRRPGIWASSFQALGVQEPDDFNDAFTAMDRDPPDAILMVSDSLTTLNRKRVFDYAAAKRLPAIYEYDPLVRDGGLMSYGPDLEGILRARRRHGRSHLQGRQAAGAAGRTADALQIRGQPQDRKGDRIEFPPALIALADEVIE